MAGILLHSLYKGITEPIPEKRVLLLEGGDGATAIQHDAEKYQVSLGNTDGTEHMLSSTFIWWANPFVWLSPALVLIVAMFCYIFFQYRAKKSAANNILEETAEPRQDAADSETTGPSLLRRRSRTLSVSEKSVVREAQIKKWRQEAEKVVCNGHLLKKASHHPGRGFQRRYFELTNRGKLSYWKNIFDSKKQDIKEGAHGKKKNIFYLIRPNANHDEPTRLDEKFSTADSLDIKIIFSHTLPEDNTPDSQRQREVLELRCATAEEREKWAKEIRKILSNGNVSADENDSWSPTKKAD